MSTSTDLIEWNNRLMIGIPMIDTQHKRLVELTNNLHFACRRGVENANLHFIGTAQEVADYMVYHFSSEQKLMTFFQYPEFPAHKKEHDIFVKDVLAQIKKFSSSKHLVPHRFVQYLKEWILSHIAVTDKALAKYILSVKDNEKLQRSFSAQG